MQCKKCGCDRFIGRQTVSGTTDVICSVDDNGTPAFRWNTTESGVLNTANVVLGEPQPPFNCVNCGAKLNG